MVRMIFIHTVQDEIVTLMVDEIAFFGPAPYKPVIKDAVFEGEGGERKMVAKPEYGPEIEICQIHLKNKVTLNIRENYHVISEMLLMFGALISLEKEGLKIHTNIDTKKEMKNGRAAPSVHS